MKDLRTVVLCHGCFDILHIGHFRHLAQARGMGDALVVSITAAKHVEAAKGAGHPAHTDVERLEQLRSLRCVDMVYLSREGSGVDAIRYWRPDIYVKGIDYQGAGINPLELAACREVGAEVRYTATEKRSVVDMVNKFKRRQG